MMERLRAALAAAAVACTFNASAMSVGPTSTYSGLNWSFSTNALGLINCTQLFVDGSGDLARGTALTLAGALNCGGGGYGASGTGYFSANGQFNMTVQIGVGVVLTCFVPGATLSGTCTVWNAGSATSIGTATINFVH